MHLVVPLCPDRVDEVDGEKESAETEQHPEDALRPVAAVLGDVTEAVEGAETKSTMSTTEESF